MRGGSHLSPVAAVPTANTIAGWSAVDRGGIAERMILASSGQSGSEVPVMILLSPTFFRFFLPRP